MTDSRSAGDRPARLPLLRLKSLWFQVTGLLCNLECTHCLVDSSPTNHRLEFLERDAVRRHLVEGEALGVKEVYFTGGEPFLHREMPGILEDTLAVAPATVLTNGTLITERLAVALGELARAARYSLEIRVSLDHPDPARNDAVRGPGVHAKAVRAAVRLDRAGLMPIVTATEFLLPPGGGGTATGGGTPAAAKAPAPAETATVGFYDAFLRLLSDAGVRRPRLKILPVFRLGKLEDPATGGPITGRMMEGFDPALLQCSEARVVTAQGIYACPILVGRRAALTGRGSLGEGVGDVVLAHHACRTCYDTGMTCGNF